VIRNSEVPTLKSRISHLDRFVSKKLSDDVTGFFECALPVSKIFEDQSSTSN
jgi:hypothetical protein